MAQGTDPEHDDLIRGPDTEPPTLVTPAPLLVVGIVAAGMGNGYAFSIGGEASLRMLEFMNVNDRAAFLSASQFGALIGCFAGARLADIFGRRLATLIGEATMVLGALFQLIVPQTTDGCHWLLLCRLVFGLGMGMCLMTKPMYISELCTNSNRGVVMSLFSFGFSLGLCTALLVDVVLSVAAIENSVAWHVELGLTSVSPSFLALLVWACFPESPFWADRFARRHAHGHLGFKASCSLVFKGQSEGQVLPLAAALLALYTMTGMPIFVGVTKKVFVTCGLGDSAAEKFMIAFAALHFTGVSIAVLLVSRFGRRPILISAASTMLVALATVVLCFAQGDSSFAAIRGFCLLLAVFCYQCGVSPVFWVLISEIFEADIRSFGMSFTLGAYLVLSMLMTSVGNYMNRIGPLLTFMICFIFGLIGLTIVVRICPESKGVPLDQVWNRKAEITKARCGALGQGSH